MNSQISPVSTSVEKKEKGASLVEYALLVALIAIVCIIAITVLGQRASRNFSQTESAMAG